MSWLPADMETLQVFQGDFELPTLDSLSPGSLEMSEMLRLFSIGPLYVPEESDAPLAGVRLALVLEAGRRFGPPDKGSEIQSGEYFYLYELADPSGDERVPAWMSTLGSRRTLMDVEIVTLTDENASFHFAMPEPRILLCSDSEDLLHEVLQRMQAGNGARAFPEQLPEWRFVDTRAQAWGLRHFDPTNAFRDQSNPIPEGRLQESGRKDFTQTDPGAVGLTYSFATGQASSPSIHYLSDRVDESMLCLNWGHGHEGISVTVEEAETGVARVRVDATNDSPLVLMLWGFFGHGIYI